MTFAAVGSGFGTANVSSFSLTPNTIGDIIICGIINASNPTVFATALSSSNVTWVTLGSSFAGSTNVKTQQVFLGTVTSTSTATVTITWSGTAPASIEIAGQEFSTTVGASSVTLDVQGHIDSTGTTTWASLTPGHGSGELYWGYAYNTGSAVAGSTSGFTYNANPDGHGNGMAYNPNCANSAQAPVWGDTTEAFGIMVLVYEASAAGPVGTVQPRATVPVPRRRPARAVWAQITGSAFVAVPAPRQEYQLAPRRKLARAIWHGITGPAFVAVPAPVQQYRLAPRRKLARAYVQFTPVVTTNAAAGPGIAGSVPVLMANQTRVIVRRDGRVVRH